MGSIFVHKLNWDDLRYVLAVAETGSVNAAAKTLDVNHATVLRRIAAFEEACGGPVFEREKSGYRLRPERAQVIEAARLAAQHVSAAETLMRGGSAGIGTTLRITSTDTLCQTLLPKILPALVRRTLPDRLAILSLNAHLDMARLHADLTIRPANTLPDELMGKQIGQMGFGVYARSGTQGPWLGLAGPLSKSLPAQWMTETVLGEDLAATADSFMVLAQMVAAGVGQAILPCLIGDATAGVARIKTQMPDFAVPLWVACHRDLSGSEKLRSLMDIIDKQFAPHRATLIGKTIG